MLQGAFCSQVHPTWRHLCIQHHHLPRAWPSPKKLLSVGSMLGAACQRAGAHASVPGAAVTDGLAAETTPVAGSGPRLRGSLGSGLLCGGLRRPGRYWSQSWDAGRRVKTGSHAAGRAWGAERVSEKGAERVLPKWAVGRLMSPVSRRRIPRTLSFRAQPPAVPTLPFTVSRLTAVQLLALPGDIPRCELEPRGASTHQRATSVCADMSAQDPVAVITPSCLPKAPGCAEVTCRPRPGPSLGVQCWAGP